jgi:hypothetical protein
MSPHDFLDGEQPDAEAALEPKGRAARRLQKRQARAARQADKAEARSAYRSKIRDARKAPRSPLALLIVGLMFFGVIIIAGTIASQNSQSAPAKLTPSSSSEPSARASSSATPTALSTPASTTGGGSEQTIASNWLIAYFAGQNWQQYVAPDAVPALTATRAPFFNGTYLQGDSVNIQEYTWRDVSTPAGGWTGAVDVILQPGRPVPLYASLKVIMSVGSASQITSVSTTYYGESPD